MNILPGKTRRALRPTALILFSPIILIIITAFVFPAATQGQIKIQVPEGGTTRTAIELRNTCAEPHTLRGTINGDTSYVRFAVPAEAVVLPGSATKNVDLIFSGVNLKQKVYKGSVSWECIDCTGKCDIKIDDVKYELTVVERAEITQLFKEFRKLFYDEIEKLGVLVDEGARNELNEILKEAAKTFLESGDPKRREEANKGIKAFVAALFANAEKREKKLPGSEFIFFLLLDEELVITKRSVNKTMKGICPLWPICK